MNNDLTVVFKCVYVCVCVSECSATVCRYSAALAKLIKKKKKRKVTIINRGGFEEENLSNRYDLKSFFFFFTPASRALDSYSYIFIDIYIFTNKIQVPPKNAAKLKLCLKTKGIREHSQYICTCGGGGQGVGSKGCINKNITKYSRRHLSNFLSDCAAATAGPSVSVPFTSGAADPIHASSWDDSSLIWIGLFVCFFCFSLKNPPYGSMHLSACGWVCVCVCAWWSVCQACREMYTDVL